MPFVSNDVNSPRYKEVVTLFAEDPAKMGPEEFFVIWQRLVQQIIETDEKITQNRDKEEKLRKREEAKAAREGLLRICTNLIFKLPLLVRNPTRLQVKELKVKLAVAVEGAVVVDVELNLCSSFICLRHVSSKAEKWNKSSSKM